MKRYGNLYEKIYSMDNLKLAHQNARKGKGWYEEVIAVNENEEHYLKLLQDMLIQHTYKTSEYETFMKKDGQKERIIYKLPYFPDRICQWAILQVIEPYLMKQFTPNTYSALPGRGIHAAFKDVRKAIDTDIVGTQYCLKLDVRKYYPSINHNVLKAKFRRLFKDADLLWLLDEIIDSISTADIKSLQDLYLLDEDIDYETGIPIGNYISQYAGNFYLSSFDHWIREEKGVKDNYRYMDDIVILHESKEYLHKLRKEIQEYFRTELKLTIKDNWQVFPTLERGLDFVGYRFFLDYTLLRKSTCKTFKQKMIHIRKKIDGGGEMNYSEWCAVNSYYGWLKYCDSYRLKQKYLEPLKPYADEYYLRHIKSKKVKKGGANHD